MRAGIRFALIAALGLLVTACGGVKITDPVSPISMGDGISVMSQIKWNQFSENGQTIWTANGLQLDSLHFLTGIKSGKPLIALPGPREDRALFSNTMLPNDLEDLVVTTLGREGYTNVRAFNLAPCPFGLATGFCFDLDFATPAGLAMKGKAIVNKHSDSLDVFQFQAPAEYYFGALAPTVGQVFASIQVK